MHRHEVFASDMRPFFGCVAKKNKCVPESHGNVVFIYRCKCGAEKRDARNAGTEETSGWVAELEDPTFTPKDPKETIR